MKVRNGLGVAFSQHGELAGNLAAVRALDQVPDPALAVVFTSVDLDPEAVSNGLRSALGRVPIFGGSARALISTGGVSEHTVVVLLMAAEGLEVSMASAPASRPPTETAAALAAALPDRDPGSQVLTLLTGGQPDGSGADLFRELAELFGAPMAIAGGGSLGGEGPNFEITSSVAFAGRELLREHLALACLQSPLEGPLRFAHGFESCWTPIAHSVTCTRADGHRVLEVDHQPIVEYLETYLGADYQTALQRTHWKYSFLETLGEGDDLRRVIRTPNWDSTCQGVTFFPRDEMQDRVIQLVQVSRDELLEGARAVAQRTLDALDGAAPRAVLAFSCHLRKGFLHSRGDDEVAAIREVFGPCVPVAGFYAAGEYAPMRERPAEAEDAGHPMSGSRQLSTSLSLVAIGEAGGEASAGGCGATSARRHLAADRAREFPETDLKLQVQELRTRLSEAEEMIDETERAFKHLNREHYQLAAKLRTRNRDLAVAQRRSERLQRIIQQYTPRTVWAKASRSVEEGFYTIPDEEGTRVLMFMDVKGFTAFAEGHSPAEVIRELNRIFEPSTDIVHDNHGDVDKFIGDCLFAVFESAPDAVNAGLEILSVVRRLRGDGSPFQVRVGVHSGRVVSGNVGGSARRDNTLIGDAVNTAQRLESACTPGRILLSREVFLAVRHDLPAEAVITRREVAAKGKSDPVPAFEISAGD